MKKLMMILALIAAVVAAPAGATSKEAVGARINPLAGQPTTFAAGSPFNVSNCWGLDPRVGDEPIGHFSIGLSVDGTLVKPSFTKFGSTESNLTLIQRCFVWNFPSGLSAGTHTFVQTWYVPCSTTSQTCSDPNEIVAYATYTLTVTFT